MQISKRNVASALIIGSLLIVPVAEAKRVGGGKSYGMSRNTTSSQNSAGQNLSGQSANQNSATPQNASQPQRSGPGVGGLVAAGAAGAAAGYMLGHSNDAQAQDATAATTSATQPAADHNFSWLWIALLAIAAFFLFRRFAAKRANASHNPFAPNNSGQGQSTKPGFANQARTQRPTAPDQNQHANTTLTNPASSSHASSNTNVFGQQVGASAGVYNHSGQQLPDGTEPAAFLRQARAKFLHLQSMNSASNIEEVRRYFTPDMYSEIRQEILSNDELAEFPQLIAHVINSGSENGQYVASVQFSGTVSESLNAQAVPFSEIWHFVKSTDSGEWLVAGIQQG